MAKRMKSVQTDSSRDEALIGASVRQSGVEDRNPQQALGASSSSGRVAIETGDRAAATAIPDSDRAENDSKERIAARAYELYLQRGGSHGRDTDDWLEAEREVSRGFDRPTDE
jgi:Protein of unknown function (DUF2934)